MPRLAPSKSHAPHALASVRCTRVTSRPTLHVRLTIVATQQVEQEAQRQPPLNRQEIGTPPNGGPHRQELLTQGSVAQVRITQVIQPKYEPPTTRTRPQPRMGHKQTNRRLTLTTQRQTKPHPELSWQQRTLPLAPAQATTQAKQATLQAKRLRQPIPMLPATPGE